MTAVPGAASSSPLTLVSFASCPYVQRAITVLQEKGSRHDVVYIDLANKPAWFVALSPLGKVPLLVVARPGRPDAVLFESMVIVDYLDEAAPGEPLHPVDPLDKARHRAWMEFGNALQIDLYAYFGALDATALETARAAVYVKLARLEAVVAGPFFAGERFCCVDAVFAPGFRQLDLVEAASGRRATGEHPRIAAWRRALASRASVVAAAPDDFADRFIGRLQSVDALAIRGVACLPVERSS